MAGIDRMVNYLGRVWQIFIRNPEVVILSGGIMGQRLSSNQDPALKTALVPSLAEKAIKFAHHQTQQGCWEPIIISKQRTI